MPLRVNNNIAAINSRRHLNANTKYLGVRLERLSSGLRVNRAADDAAGLSVREGMRSEVAGLRINVLNSEAGGKEGGIKDRVVQGGKRPDSDYCSSRRTNRSNYRWVEPGKASQPGRPLLDGDTSRSK